MPDNTLSFETKVDLTGLESGMNAASSTVSAGAQKMARAMSVAKGETAALGQAYKQLGQMAAAGNSQAIAAIAEHIQATNAAKAAVKSLAAEEKAAAAAEAAAAEATNQLAESEEQEERVVRSSISTRMAASAELRVMEGSLQGSTRAAGALLAMIPGLGEAMQTLFAAFGAVALIEILVQLGEKLHDVAVQFDVVAQAEKRAGVEATAAIQGMQTATEKASIAARDLFENQFGHVAALKSDLAGLKLTINSDDITKITQAEQKVSELQRRIAAGTHTFASGTTSGPNGEAVVGTQTLVTPDAQAAQKDMEAATISLSTARIQLKSDTDTLKTSQIQLTEAEEEAAQKGEAAANKAAQARLRALEQELNQEKLLHSVSLADEFNFWNQRLALFSSGSAQYGAILAKMATMAETGANKAHEAIEKLKKAQVAGGGSNAGAAEFAAGQKAIDDWLKITAEDATHSGERWRSYNEAVARAAEITAQNAASLELANIAQDQAFGSMTKLGASHAIAAVHAEEYTIKLRALEEELRRINNDSSLKPNEKAAQAQGIQNSIASLQGGRAVQQTQDTTSQAQAMAAPYLKAFDTINNGFLGVTNKMIMGTQSISRDFAQMGASLVVSTADSFEKMLAKSLQYEIQSTLAHQLANTSKVASDASAAATTDAISTQSAFMQIEHEAATAAAKAWSALSGIPIVGPVLGAAAAGATYAGVMALAAFETGGIIPNTGVALVHQGEAVLPRGLTDFLMNAAGGSSSTSSTASMTVNNHGMSDAGFRQAATRNARHMVNVVHRGLRKQGRV